MSERSIPIQVIEQLRKGIPPERGVDLYSVGNEKLIDGVKRYHLSGIEERGIIRFISGSWGAGKTHFFRLLREVAFADNCLVANVELNVNDAALDRFERVFSAVVRHIRTPRHFASTSVLDVDPFGGVLRETMGFLGSGQRTLEPQADFETHTRALERLMADKGIDIDFKKMVEQYWKTFLPDSGDSAIQDQVRGEVLQWFSGEGTVGAYRKRFGVNKLVARENAKLMLQSLASFVRLSGYKGLVILFDEAEQAYSVMRRSQLRNAQNNLLSLINNVEALAGLLLIYATTPDFYTDPKHGIVTYGALAGRIGRPTDTAPRALDTIWNLDAADPTLSEYQSAARKIKAVYATAYPDGADRLPADDDTDKLVGSLHSQHPALSAIRFWRLLVAATVAGLDDALEGESRNVERLYSDVMDRLREE